jgi:hypothetical protein
VSVMFNTTVPGTSIPKFTSQQKYGTGFGPDFVSTTDVNGDGKPDLVVANGYDTTVSVLLNKTAPGAIAPSFAAQRTFFAGNDPRSVAAVDVNGDGKPDLVVANVNENTVSVLLNTTAPGVNIPSFAGRRTFVAGNGPAFVSAADINGDGRPDVVVSNVNDNTVSLLLNTSAPGTSTPSFGIQTFATGFSPLSVALADVNGDGKPDLVVTNELDNTASVLLNTQYRTTVFGSPATGTIVPDKIFANGFE